jgi:hypothetical protein
MQMLLALYFHQSHNFDARVFSTRRFWSNYNSYVRVGINLIVWSNLNAGSIAFTNGGAASAARHQITISNCYCFRKLTQTGSTGSASITLQMLGCKVRRNFFDF